MILPHLATPAHAAGAGPAVTMAVSTIAGSVTISDHILATAAV